MSRPLQCMVGCTACANLCMGEAISFPDIKELREVCKKSSRSGLVLINVSGIQRGRT